MPGVSLPIIDQLIHPSLGALYRTAFPANPYAGPFQSFAPPQGLTVLTYGVALILHSVGTFHGHDVSFPIEYVPSLGKMCSTYQDHSGSTIIQQVEHWTYTNQWYVWNEALPTLWNIYLAPDVTVDLFWLQTV